MEVIRIEGTEDTPKVELNVQTKIFEISGRSLPEDCAEFYKPVLDWLERYSKTPLDSTDFEIKLEYFNTASSKIILDVLTKLEKVKDAGKKVVIHWYYHEDDEDMEEAGQEFSELVELPFELKTY